jgi:2-dehydro-3-deoxy-D-arabinonate dehydratase
MIRIYHIAVDKCIAEQDKKFRILLSSFSEVIKCNDIAKLVAKEWEKSSPTKLNEHKLLAPIASDQELWACGVTYLNSKIGREEESKDAGGGDFYHRVYFAARPEVFFKATPNRIVGPFDKVNIRKDSTWDVPEPELTLVVNPKKKIIGYTIGNDMSSRSIEGENPLYLPQAKTYDACAAVGPCILVGNPFENPKTSISLTISRNGEKVFQGKTLLSQMKRKPQELVNYVYRECSFPNGCLVMTGTGIVPPATFTLQVDDVVDINITDIGILTNIISKRS